MRFSVTEYVRWEDIDAAGIINYQASLRFFGLPEAELLRSAGLLNVTLEDNSRYTLRRDAVPEMSGWLEDFLEGGGR